MRFLWERKAGLTKTACVISIVFLYSGVAEPCFLRHPLRAVESVVITQKIKKLEKHMKVLDELDEIHPEFSLRKLLSNFPRLEALAERIGAIEYWGHPRIDAFVDYLQDFRGLVGHPGMQLLTPLLFSVLVRGEIGDLDFCQREPGSRYDKKAELARLTDNVLNLLLTVSQKYPQWVVPGILDLIVNPSVGRTVHEKIDRVFDDFIKGNPSVVSHVMENDPTLVFSLVDTMNSTNRTLSERSSAAKALAYVSDDNARVVVSALSTLLERRLGQEHRTQQRTDIPMPGFVGPYKPREVILFENTLIRTVTVLEQNSHKPLGGVKTLVKVFKQDVESEVREEALVSLMKLGIDLSPFISNLIDGFRPHSFQNHALVALVESDPRMFSLYLDALGDENVKEHAKIRFIRFLADFPESTDNVVRAISEHFDGFAFNVRRVSIEVLTDLAIKNDKAIKVLLDLLEHGIEVDAGSSAAFVLFHTRGGRVKYQPKAAEEVDIFSVIFGDRTEDRLAYEYPSEVLVLTVGERLRSLGKRLSPYRGRLRIIAQEETVGVRRLAAQFALEGLEE